MTNNCEVCGKRINNCKSSQKFHKKCYKERAKELRKEYNQRPYVKEKRRKYAEKYKAIPGVKEKLREYAKEYRERPGVRERMCKLMCEKSKMSKIIWDQLPKERQLELIEQKSSVYLYEEDLDLEEARRRLKQRAMKKRLKKCT